MVGLKDKKFIKYWREIGLDDWELAKKFKLTVGEVKRWKKRVEKAKIKNEKTRTNIIEGIKSIYITFTQIPALTREGAKSVAKTIDTGIEQIAGGIVSLQEKASKTLKIRKLQEEVSVLNRKIQQLLFKIGGEIYKFKSAKDVKTALETEKVKSIFAKAKKYEEEIEKIKVQILQLEGKEQRRIPMEKEKKTEISTDEKLCDQAIQFYKKAIELNPEYAEAWRNLGEAYRDKGFLNEAISSYKKAINLEPNIGETYYKLGLCFEKLREVDKASYYFGKAIQINPDDSLSHNALGKIYYQKRDFDKALIHFKQAIEIDPGFTEVYENMGMVYEALHNLDEAIFSYQKAIEFTKRRVF